MTARDCPIRNMEAWNNYTMIPEVDTYDDWITIPDCFVQLHLFLTDFDATIGWLRELQ